MSEKLGKIDYGQNGPDDGGYTEAVDSGDPESFEAILSAVTRASMGNIPSSHEHEKSETGNPDSNEVKFGIDPKLEAQADAILAESEKPKEPEYVPEEIDTINEKPGQRYNTFEPDDPIFGYSEDPEIVNAAANAELEGKKFKMPIEDDFEEQEETRQSYNTFDPDDPVFGYSEDPEIVQKAIEKEEKSINPNGNIEVHTKKLDDGTIFSDDPNYFKKAVQEIARRKTNS